jgi:hypothetical protein
MAAAWDKPGLWVYNRIEALTVQQGANLVCKAAVFTRGTVPSWATAAAIFAGNSCRMAWKISFVEVQK